MSLIIRILWQPDHHGQDRRAGAVEEEEETCRAAAQVFYPRAREQRARAGLGFMVYGLGVIREHGSNEPVQVLMSADDRMLVADYRLTYFVSGRV